MSNDTNASDASYSLANALNTLAVTGLNYGGVTGFDCNANLTFCAIWTGASDHTFGAQYTFGTVHAPWSSLFTTDGTLGCPQTTSNDLSLCYEAAHWTKVTVPEPGIVGWFVVGLIGIGLALGRQKKRKLD